ncbi:helix-turn-helix domain-containing protein [Zoogloea dura]|uniref:Helix-turn-helix transcriptional regulator n=1 Tax=Zoogloea dura TaxID=2728840 RepID=A0A848GCH0_9RHOO|nr:helix-turn-helix transcriptional regulator [Zoogloea dura]NML29024.1 helix-turn-helix transcriptional regulator [Zoogloea dura]
MSTLTRRFGLVVRRHRVARGWSQEEFADRAGLSRSYSGEVERGNSTPSLATVLKIAEALGASPSVLVEEAERDIRPGGVRVARSPVGSLVGV